MAQRPETAAAEPKHTSERSDPIPLADRRRLLRPAQTLIRPGQLITDWASF